MIALYLKKQRNCNTNVTRTKIVNHVDTLYQVININAPQLSYATKQKPSKLMQTYGYGVNLGYVQNVGLNYNALFRYKSFTFGGSYYPAIDAVGVNIGLMF